MRRHAANLTSLYSVPWWRHQNGNIFGVIERGIHRSPVNSPHKSLWRRALMFSLICAWINAWVNNRKAGDFRRHRSHYDAIVMIPPHHDDSAKQHAHNRNWYNTRDRKPWHSCSTFSWNKKNHYKITYPSEWNMFTPEHGKTVSHGKTFKILLLTANGLGTELWSEYDLIRVIIAFIEYKPFINKFSVNEGRKC